MPAKNYASDLVAHADAITQSRSGERTRLNLLAAGARLLDKSGYRDLNVAGICEAAEQAKGTFYVYFETKERFLLELLRSYVPYELTTYPQLSPKMSAYPATKIWITWYERTFAQNAGILRCMVQRSELDPDVQRIWHERNRHLVDRAVHEVVSRLTRQPKDPELLRNAIRATGGMLDQSLFERSRIHAGPGLERMDGEHLIELHSILSYRALYGRNPPRGEVPTRLRPLLDLP
ncbi:MAG: TetR/AcrR family transcriptional regulator [Gemmatimonadota bacterium]